MTELTIDQYPSWLENAVSKVKDIQLQWAKETFKRYRECGKIVLESGYRRGQWHSEHKERFLKETNLERTTFQQMIQLGEMTDLEFTNAVGKFPSYHAWANRGSLAKIEKREREIAVLREAIKVLEPPKQLYDVIVVDPPWPFEIEYDPENWRGPPPYPTLTIDEIKNLQLPSAENSIIWLWTTNRFLHDAYHILESWGYEPKTILTWVKTRNFGVGVWLRGQSEHCIFAVKGQVKDNIELTNQSTVLFAENTVHSEKPDEFYELVDKLCLGWKLDYFGRKKREGWDVYGTCERA